MYIPIYKGWKLDLVCFSLIVIVIGISSVWAVVFDEVSSLHVWITISSLANKDPNNNKALLFRQIELNWINAPLEDENDYIGLYLDSQPDDNTLPVSVHRLNGQTSGQIITDYYLPQIDFYNDTNTIVSHSSTTSSGGSYSREQMSGGQGSHESNGGDDFTDREGANFRLRRFNDDGGGGLFNTGISRSNNHHHPATKSTLNDECVGYCLAYHSRNKILARNCLKTNPNWMFDSFQYIGARSLPSLMIPGTHNSGTYLRQLDKTVLHMINKYQANQDESIFNQLIYGIRHLDLRVGYNKVKQRPERLWVYHDIFRTEVSVNEVFDQVKRFLDLTSHEIVIMDFHRFTVGFQNENLSVQRERHSKLIDLIFKQLGQYIVPSYLGQHAPLNEYVSTGRRLIIGYANKGSIIGSQAEHQSIFGLHSSNIQNKQQVRDIDAAKQDQEETIDFASQNHQINDPVSSQQHQADQSDRRVGSRLFNKIKSLKLISNSFSKRSIDTKQSSVSSQPSMKIITTINSNEDSQPESTMNSHEDLSASVSRVALFFPAVRHLWPNKDTIDGLAQYMNDTTCRKYFGELRSMMVELTPTVFGAISDKYDGNRKLAQQVNRPVTDWIRDRWLHCINIVASDFFLGNDLIRLSIYANKMRVLHRNVDLNSYGQCRSFRRVEHLLDKSKIPIQFAYQHSVSSFDISSPFSSPSSLNGWRGGKDNDIITHTSSDGNKILLKPLTPSFNAQSVPRERRDSFVENVSDGLTNLVSSFKRLLNL